MTDFQRTILHLAARGLTNKEIATELELSERSIKNYFSILFKQMKAKNRTHAVAMAIAKGIIEGVE